MKILHLIYKVFSHVVLFEEGCDLNMFMEFLYFPEDKSEYIPAFITLVIFMIGAIATMYLFYRKSKKDEKYFDEKYELHNRRHSSSHGEEE